MKDPSPDLRIKIKSFQNSRSVVGCYGDFRVVGDGGRIECIGYVPSFHSFSNSVGACIHRFGRKMKDYDVSTQEDFEAFSKHLIETIFTPLTLAELCTFEEWLDKTSYSGERKEALRKLWREPNFSSETLESKAFGKWEVYDEMKQMRAINSPSDLSKAILGPLIYSSDKQTFRTKYFVKGSDPRTWPAKLRAAFGGRPVVETDFSSFESHHRGCFARVVRHWLHHMTGSVATRLQVFLIDELVNGINRSVFKHITASIPECLMSGAMWTSSANGVLNLCIMGYLAARTRVPRGEVEDLVQWFVTSFNGFVEGDDGICEDVGVQDDLIEKLGVDLAFDRHDNFCQANFCGITCPFEDGAIITNPINVLRKFFLIPPQYMRSRRGVIHGLIRAKALSYITLYRDCPIIGELAHRVLFLTRCVVPKFDLLNPHSISSIVGDDPITKPNVQISTRILMSEKFGISVERQLSIEKEIRSSGPAFEIFLADLIPAKDLDFSLDHLITESGATVNYTNTEKLHPHVLMFCEGTDMSKLHPPLVGKFPA